MHYTLFSMSNVEENHRKKSNNHSQISYRSQVLTHFDQIQVKKEKRKSFLIKKFL